MDAQAEADAAPVCDGGAQPIGMAGEVCCTPNELACAGHAQKAVLFCSPKSGLWEALQSCSGKLLCDTSPGLNQGSCQEPVPICIGRKPGFKQCNGKVQQTCDAQGARQAGTACQYVCTTGTCSGVCMPGGKDCNGLVPRLCDSAGQWQSGTPCTYYSGGAGTTATRRSDDTADQQYEGLGARCARNP